MRHYIVWLVLIATSVQACARSRYSAAFPLPVDYRVSSDRRMDSGGLGELAIDQRARLLYGVGDKIIDIEHDSVIDVWHADIGHGFAFAYEIGTGISRRGAIFDLNTRAILQAGNRYSAQAVAYDHVTRHAAINFDTVALLDARTGKSAGRIALGPSGSVIADGEGHFLLDVATDTLVEIDARRAAVTHRWALAPCRSPGGMAIDQRARRVFVSCRNDVLVVLDLASGKTVATLANCHAGNELAYDQMTHLLFVPSEHDTLAIIRQKASDGYEVATLPVGQIAPVVALDEHTHIVYLAHFGRTQETRTIVYLMTVKPTARVSVRQ